MVFIYIFIAMLFKLYRYECEIKFSKPFNGFYLTLWIGAKPILLVETSIPREFKTIFFPIDHTSGYCASRRVGR